MGRLSDITRSQHNDWGRAEGKSDAGNAQAGQGESRQGPVPGEEAGELQTGLGGIESLSTGHAGSKETPK